MSRASRVALVTGASSGIGRAIAQRLARDGLEVYGTSRKVPSDHPGPSGIHMLPLDVTSDMSVQACVEGLWARTGRIDVLVNCAGYLMVGAVEEFAPEEARALFETNFFGVVRMIQAVAPKMRQQRDGAIVNLSSLAGLVPFPFWGYYSASKFAVEGLTEALREELRPFGIRVSAVEPGTIQTALYTAGQKARSMEAYAPRRARFEKTMRRFEEKAPGPEVVAERVSRIVHSRSPALRNPITREARVLPLLRAWFPRSWFDQGLRATFHLDDEHF